MLRDDLLFNHQQRRDKMTDRKASFYRTAKAKTACAYFLAGDYVSVKYQRTERGCHWFEVSKNGKDVTYYPEHHLTEFCL